MEPQTDPVQERLKPGNLPATEGLILALAACNREFYNSRMGRVCEVKTDDRGRRIADYEDFAKPVDNAIFRAIRYFRQFEDGVDGINIVDHIDAMLERVINEDHLLTEVEIPLAKQRAREACTKWTPTVARVVARSFEAVVPEWLKLARIRQLQSSGRVVSADDYFSEVAKITESASSITRAEYVFDFEQGILTEDADRVQRIPVPLDDINTMTGGGFARGETCCVIAPSGGGKTTDSLQHVAFWALQCGLKGMYCYTEQTMPEHVARIVCNCLNIPFEGQIRDGVTPSLLSASLRDNLEMLRKDLTGRVKFIDWQKKSLSVMANLEDEINNAREQLGGLDFLVFDWLGAGLGDMVGKDPAMQRLLYKASASKICTLCTNHNIIGRFYVQAMASASKEPFLDHNHVGECKSVHERAAFCMGISTLTLIDSGDNKVYKKEQNMHFSKTRKGPAATIKVQRNFKYQRFAGRNEKLD